MIEREPVAIVGVAGIFPGSTDTAGFWNDIVNGRDLLSDVPPHYWLVDDYYDPDPAAPDKTYGRRGAFLSPIEFDSLEFGIPPAALPAIDSSQLLALIAAKRVLCDAACGRAEHVSKDRISIFLGLASTTSAAMNMAARLQRPAWIKGMRESGIPESKVQEVCDRIAACFTPLQENTFPGLLSNVVAGRIANRFNLGGANFTTDAACASSLAAVSVAINDLHLGQSDMVLTGGVDALNDIQMFMCFSKTPALSATEDCRPFSSRADGTMLGEGLCMFALRRLSDAERDGDQIYALIRGLGSSSDGLAKSVYAPHSAGQAVALRRAYEAAGFGPETVELLEAHGTATPAGDQAEFEALRQVFSAAKPEGRQWCALGSVKSQIGHTKGAAGAAGLFKTAMALHHKTLPPTIKVEQPNQALAIEESPFYLNTAARPWIHSGDGPRRAALSSFGFGGANFHVAFEEYDGRGRKPPRLSESPVELILISAPNAAAAVREAGRFADSGAQTWRRAARESQRAFDPSCAVRIAAVSRSYEDNGRILSRITSALEKSPEQAIRDPDGLYYEPHIAAGPVAFLFPGQGSQYVGSGAELAMAFDCARESWDFAEGVLQENGFSLREAVFPRPVFRENDRQRQTEFLTRTENAQPALAAASLAQFAVLRLAGLDLQFAAGHSFGELTALHAAGSFSAGDLLRMARKRGELMAANSRTGAMTAVSHPIDKLRSLLDKSGWNGIVIANHNSPRQAVLSGKVASIEAAEDRLTAASVSFRRLRVSGAFHSPLMAGAVEPFARFLDDIDLRSPSAPVFSNADATCYPLDPALVRERIAANLVKPVLFADEIEVMYEAGVRVFVEVGSGSVLRQLTAHCLHDKPHLAIALEQEGAHGVTSLWHALGQLSVAGVKIGYQELWPAFNPVPARSAPARPSSTVLIDGAGYNRPYPPKSGSSMLPKPNPEIFTAKPSPEAAQGASAPARVAETDSIFELIQAQISEAQKTSQAAILESLSISLKSLETIARDLVGDAVPGELRVPPEPALTTPTAAAVPASPPASNLSPEPKPAASRERALLEIVAEKTGYPIEVLRLDAELEAELGIDSIKRVEIFAAIQQRIPDLPEAPPAEIGKVKTLRDILAMVGGKSQATSAHIADEPSALTRHELRFQSSEVSALPMSGLFTCGPIAVVDAGSDVAQAVVTRLGGPGLVVDSAANVPAGCRAAIYLGGLRPFDSAEESARVNYEAFDIARALAGGSEPPKLFVTVHDSGRDFGAWAAGLSGIAKTFACECPEAGVKTIDLHRGLRPPSAIADAIVAELLTGGSQIEVRLGEGGAREVPILDPVVIKESVDRIGSDSLVVASGGGRGITAACLIELARTARPRIAILGRTVLGDEPADCREAIDEAELKRVLSRRAGVSPNLREISREAAGILAAREIRSTMRSIERAGSVCAYFSADMRDPAAVWRAVASARERFGLVTAIIHGAGAIADRKIADKTSGQFALVFETKAVGLRALLAATETDPIDTICLFSSVAARFGNPGQCDYAAANEALNRVAVAEAGRRNPRCMVRSIAWGPWDGGMVTAPVAAHFRSRGAGLIAMASGARAFVRELKNPAGPVEVLISANGDRFSESNSRTEWSSEILVNRTMYPFLDSHRIKDYAVVPLVLVNEWFHRFAESCRPGMQVAACRDLRVLRGIPLPAFEAEGHLLSDHRQDRG